MTGLPEDERLEDRFASSGAEVNIHIMVKFIVIMFEQFEVRHRHPRIRIKYRNRCANMLSEDEDEGGDFSAGSKALVEETVVSNLTSESDDGKVKAGLIAGGGEFIMNLNLRKLMIKSRNKVVLEFSR